jgi:hypothetical protein
MTTVLVDEGVDVVLATRYYFINKVGISHFNEME